MSRLDEFTMLLQEFDQKVFGTRSEVLYTSSPDILELANRAGEILYISDKKYFLERHPKVIADCPMPDQNFFLIQTTIFRKRIYVCSGLHDNEGLVGVMFLDTAIKAMVDKIIERELDFWGSIEYYVTYGGLFSAEEIANITGIFGVSVMEIKKYMEKEYRDFLYQYRKKCPSSVQTHKGEYFSKVVAQKKTIFKCVQQINFEFGTNETLSALRNFILSAHKPQ